MFKFKISEKLILMSAVWFIGVVFLSWSATKYINNNLRMFERAKSVQFASLLLVSEISSDFNEIRRAELSVALNDDVSIRLGFLKDKKDKLKSEIERYSEIPFNSNAEYKAYTMLRNDIKSYISLIGFDAESIQREVLSERAKVLSENIAKVLDVMIDENKIALASTMKSINDDKVHDEFVLLISSLFVIVFSSIICFLLGEELFIVLISFLDT